MKPHLLMVAIAGISFLGVPSLADESQTEESSDTIIETTQLSTLTGKAKDFEDIDLISLLNVDVVTASKMQQAVEEAPSIVTVFTREEIAQLGVTRLIDLLRLTPGFAEVSAPMERNLASRGVHSATSQNVAVLIDGLRMNDFLTNSAPPDSFILDMAERVEIIRGPGAVLYGANALTGVVNIITRSASHSEGFTNFLAGYGSYDSLRLALQKGVAFEDRSNLFMALSYLQSRGTPVQVSGSEDILVPRLGQNVSNGIQDGQNLTLPRASTPVWVNSYGPSFEGFIKYQKPEDWAIRLGLGLKQFNPQRTDMQSLLDIHNQLQRPYRQDMRLSLDLSKSWGQTDGWGNLSIRPLLQYFSHDQRSQRIAEDYYDLAANESRKTIVSWSGEEFRTGLHLEYAKDFGALSFIKDLFLAAGARLQYDVAYDYKLSYCRPDRDHQFDPGPYDEGTSGHDLVCFDGAPLLDEGTLVDKWGNRIPSGKDHLGSGDDLQVGTYLQLYTKLPGDLGVTLGGRLEVNPDFLPMFTPQVALVWPFVEHFYVKGLYSSAFVYPPFLYRTDNRQAGFVGNPDMVPQNIHTFELLLGYKRPTLMVEINGYYNMLREFISSLKGRDSLISELQSFDNVGNLTIAGMEAIVKALFFDGKFIGTLSCGFTHTFEEETNHMITGTGSWAPSYPPFFASGIFNLNFWQPLNINISTLYLASANVDLKRGDLFTNVADGKGVRFTSKGASDYDTGLFLLNANVIYSFLTHWQAIFTVSNLLGTSQRMAGATVVPYATEGRQILLSVGYQE